MKKTPKVKYVTHAFFHDAMKGFNEKLDLALKRLETAGTNTAYALLKGEQRLEHVEAKMVTKEDSKIFATKEDLKDLAINFLKLDSKVEFFKNDVKDHINSSTMKLMDHMDFIRGRIEVFDRQSTFNGHRLRELEPVVKNHEARISALEMGIGDKPAGEKIHL